MAQNNLSERWEEYYSTAIQKGLKAALEDSSIEKSFDEIEDGHIKLDKLMYIAMAERGLHEEMQHSWHRYGGDLGTLVPSTHTVEPAPLDNLPATERPVSPSDQQSKDNIWDEQDYREFFKDVSIGALDSLEAILNTDKTTLLREFYTEYSGDIENWVDLYLINVRVQEVLHLYKDSESLNNFDQESYLDFVDTLEAFEAEMYSHQELSPTGLSEYDLSLSKDENPADLLSDFLELIDDIYFTISQRDMDQFRGDLSYQLSMVEEFYHDRAWNIVTKIISMNTMHGPNQEALLEGSISDFERLISGYSIRMERIESECRAIELLPKEQDNHNLREESVNSKSGHQLPTREEFRQALEGK
ncbi:hypothetical protein HZS55_14855 [Halosimplex rubrum]|uniref:DUF8098 domain-containing protein n=1 Tax=Halosimplex rubrum TaxID=869889 RepID=A0A7D5SZ50_9EURY|nr:hypothetical protein [Halosimplex rubrum]QLH78491.1 hypothetical protein HZS55_14855 [Halosimplex rubrum]